ncbi:MAG: long-chain-fatty-acid--CoA ligase [Bryobacteraceae bacterium]
MISPLTPLSFLARSAMVYPNKIAVVDGERRYSYTEFNERVHRLGAALRSAGVEKGDRVAVLAQNSPAALEPHYGVPLIGAVLVMLNYRLNGAELAWMLDHCEAKVLITQPEFLPMIEPELHRLGHLQLMTDDYESLLARGALPLADIPEPEENDVISINYTSGTTGFPKGVMHTHRGAYLNALGEVMEMNIREDSSYLWTVPMFHCNGWCFTWAVTAAGARHICLPRVDPERIVECIEKEGVTHMGGAPVVVNTLANYCSTRGITFPRKVRITTAGAPPSPAVIRGALEMGAEVEHVYGLTETYGPHTICAWRSEWNELSIPDHARKKARQGVPYAVNGTELRVVDDSMNDVPRDGQTMGEIIMRGNNVMAGYFKNPKATEEAFRGGWFHSGDIAVWHADGYVEIRDRSKDIIISGGENISSVEVERTLWDHPAVLEAAVVAFPDERWGEVPKAHVTLKEGAEATAAELIEFCRSRLAHFKCPKHIEFGLLPKTATGKIRKNELRAAAWAGHETTVKG